MRGMAPDQLYDDDACLKIKKVAASRVGPLVWLLRKVGGKAGKKMASLLSVGMRTFETINTKKYDLDTFFDAKHLLRLEVRCGGAAAGQRARLGVRGARRTARSGVVVGGPASLSAVRRDRPLCLGPRRGGALRHPGTRNAPHIASRLTTHPPPPPPHVNTITRPPSIRPQAALAPEEHADFQITWRAPPHERFMPATAAAGLDGGKAAAAIIANGGAPPPGAAAGAAAAVVTVAGGGGAAKGALAPAAKLSADGGDAGSAAGSEGRGGGRIAARHGDADAAPGRVCDWTEFNYNAFAYLYKSLFGKQLPPASKIPKRRVKKLMPFFSKPEVEACRRVTHSFSVIRAGSSS